MCSFVSFVSHTRTHAQAHTHTHAALTARVC
jgi:hypothetical protein